MQQTQNAEGTASGTTVTTVNSATGGDAYTTVNIGAGCAFTFDNGFPAHGSNAYKMSVGGTSTTVSGIQTFTGVAGAVTGRFYLYVPTVSGFGYTNAGVRLRGAGAQSGRYCFDALGRLLIKDSGNSVVGTGAVSMLLDSYYRVEFTMTKGASSTASCDLYLADSAISLDTVSVAAQNFGTNNIDEFGIGCFTATTNVGPFYFDDTVVNDTGRPGPAVTPGPPVAPYVVRTSRATLFASNY